MRPKISVIAAVAQNGVIGQSNGLPWRIKSEMQYFMRTTLHKPVIMGRKTFESLRAPLKDRTNIVVTRDASYERAGIIVAPSLESAIEIAKKIALETGVGEIMIAGGAEIYRQALPLAERLYLTEIQAQPEGDAFFPPFDRSLWRETMREFCKAQENESHDYALTISDRLSQTLE